MSQNPFAQPASGTKITDFEGSLLIVTPIEYRESFMTSLGDTDVVVANIVVVNEKSPDKSAEHTGALIFQKVLKGQLRPLIGTSQPVLGRLGKRKSAKPGTSDAWSLNAANDADIALGVKYLDALKANPFKSSAPSEDA